MRKKRKQGIARILAFVLMFVTVFQSAVTDVHAVSSNDLVDMMAAAGTSVSGSDQEQANVLAVAEGNFVDTAPDVWWQMKAASTHGNAHPHQPEPRSFFAVCDEGTVIGSEDFSVTIQSASDQSLSRGGFMNKYITDTKYSFIGWDADNWFVQRSGGFKSFGKTITIPQKGDEFTISGHWNADGQLEITVKNITQGKTESATVTDDAINGLKDEKGKFGLRASGYGGEGTEFLFKNVMVGSLAYAGGWNSLYAARDGQILQEYSIPAQPKLWHIKSSGQYGNGEFGSGSPAFFVVDEGSAIAGENFSVSFMPTLETNRFAFLNKYVGSESWSYIGYNPSNWYIQWAGTGKNWHDIDTKDIPLPNPYDMVTVDGEWTDGGLQLKVTIDNGVDAPAEYSTLISDANFAAYKDQAGKIGFRAADYGSHTTEAYISSVAVGGQVWAGSLTELGETKGGLVETVDALPENPVKAEGKIWHITSSGQHRNGELGSASPAFFVADEKSSLTDEAFSAVFMPVLETNRFGFMNKYIDNDNWSYIGYNTSNWYVQWAGTGKNWHDIDTKDIPLPNPYDMVTVDGEWTDGGLQLKVTIDNGVDAPAEYSTLISDTDFAAYKDQAGKIGFRAAGYQNSDDSVDITEAYVKSVSIGGKAWTGSLTAVGDALGGTVEAVENLPSKPVSGEGRMWYYVKGGGGGHNYMGDGSGPATAVDKDNYMPKDGKISLTIKPDTNSNNFGIFYTIKDNDNWLYVGYDTSSHWYYQYKYNGDGSYAGLGSLPEVEEGTPLDITISVANETLMVTVNEIGVNKPVDEFKKLMEAVDGQGRFGVMVKGTSMMFTDVKLGTRDCMNDNWGLLTDRSGQLFDVRFTSLVDVSGKVTDVNTKEPLVGATVRIGNLSGITGQDGTYLIEDVEEGSHRTSASMKDYVSSSSELTVRHEDKTITGVDFALLSKGAIDLTKYRLIESDEMKAYVGRTFPVVLRYLDKEDNTIFVGQEADINQVKINGRLITPQVTVQTDLGQDKLSSVAYSLAVKDETASIDLVMDVLVSLDGKNLTWEVTKLTKNTGCANIATIEVPELNLVTIDAYGTASEFMGAKVSTDTNASGDQKIGFGDGEGFVPNQTSGYLYGFISSNGYSAGLYSNSEAEGDLRVIRANGGGEISLTSAPWYYEMGDANGQKYAANHGVESYKTSELPIVKVCLADDLNKDGVADWQDGAIAYRSIMHNAMGTDAIKDIVNYRIVMNFASMAPNPYLETADNIKKVYLATDGLPQAVMLKGYGNEGHDSANSEYADIAEREGGVEDFQELIKIAHQYNTEVGIHVNAQEVYPEAASFSETMIGKNTTGIGGGWGWLDQSHTIDKLWDLQSQARYKRFVQLYDRINGTSFYSKKWDPDNKLAGAVGESTGTVADMSVISADAALRADNMDFIYLDVWYQDSWETRRIAEEINSLGWRFTTEFSAQGEYDSTWQHWSTDAPYGGSTSKGFNSDVIRFIRNDQRDSQVLNYPQYGGTADNPLLGGYFLYGFEGWGGDSNFNNYLYHTYKDNLPTRFLQHYQVTNWETYEEGKSPVGNHEKAITLKNDKGDVVRVSRIEEQRNDENIERDITLNGKLVLHCDKDEFAYLLPWTDNQDGSEKLYHWNMYSTETTWELPKGWDVSSVNVYKLTDQGRGEKQTIPVVDGKVSLTAEAGVPYVVVKTEGVKTLKAYFGENDYVVDPGFNGYKDGEKLKSAYWTGDLGSFTVLGGTRGDQYVQVDSPAGTVSASTTISGLTPGKDYVAEIYVDNRSDAKAILEITNGKEVLSNYTLRSIAQNYVKCDEQHTGTNNSYMQHILIPFTAEQTSAVFTIKREAGEGVTMWDDIRVVQQTISNYQADGSFVQDFESVVQGLYPFVLGSAQGVSDPVTHLAELHAPFTQYGWNGRVIDDVLDGKYSLKHHGANLGIIYQTIPQNFRFEENKVYKVSVDYQTGASGAFAMVIGNGTSYEYPSEFFDATLGASDRTKTYTFTVVGAEGGQTWIGLYCNGQNGDGKMGQRDFNLDNLKIAEDTETVIIYGLDGKTDLLVGESLKLKATNSANAEWTSSDEAVVMVDASGNLKAIGAGSAVITVKNDAGKSASVEITVSDGKISEVTPVDAKANTYQAGSGEAENAVDGDTNTVWHSAWNGFNVSADNKAVILVDLGEEKELNGFYYINRPSGTNGIIQKYQWAAGNELDEAGQMITDSQLSDIVEPANQNPGGRNEVKFDTPVKVRYLQISVSQGVGNFASIAELGGLVKEKVATRVTLDPAEAEVIEDDTLTLVPSGVDGTILVEPVWESSDNTVATVENGVVTALKPGVVHITYTTGNGASAAAVITVKEKPKAPDKELLKSTYEYALTLSTEGVTESAAKFFEKALAEAKKVLDDPDADQPQIDKAWDDLTQAIWGLGIYQGDKTALKMLIDKADSMTANKDKYVPENWPALEKALAEAKTVMEDGDALDEDIRPAADALNKAIALQRYKADKSNLEELINKAKTVDESLYTPESVSIFRAAFKAANDIMANQNLSEEDQPAVDQAAKDLQLAMANLTPKDDGKGEEPSGGDDRKEEPSGDNGNDHSGSGADAGEGSSVVSPKTGDYNSLTAGILVLIAGAGLIYLSLRQLKKKRH